MRVRNFEVHKIRDDEEEEVIKVPSFPAKDISVGFTEYGKKIEIEVDDCFCKITNTNNVVHHFVKVGFENFMFDPWDMLAEGMNSRHARQSNEPVWQFKRVSQGCFENYYRFLVTRSKAWLRQAEREAI